MDNLFFSAHKGERVRDLIEERGSASLSLYLPPYSSPELNPIEQAFWKVEKDCAAQSRGLCTREVLLIEAMGAALCAVSAAKRPQDSSGIEGVRTNTSPTTMTDALVRSSQVLTSHMLSRPLRQAPLRPSDTPSSFHLRSYLTVPGPAASRCDKSR
jgi:DDE superfamily endonuclease